MTGSQVWPLGQVAPLSEQSSPQTLSVTSQLGNAVAPAGASGHSLEAMQEWMHSFFAGETRTPHWSPLGHSDVATQAA